MKKIFFSVFVLCFLCGILFSFNLSNQNSGVTSADQTHTTNTLSNAIIETPPEQYSYTFESYDELLKALTQKKSDAFLNLREEQTNCGAVYKNTLDKFATGDIKLAAPQSDGKALSLRNKEGYSNISLFTSELYNLPWIWYHCVAYDKDLTVKISYLDAIDSPDIKSGISAKEIMNMIAPSAPSPDNYENYETYKVIYEKNIVINGETPISAIISELKDSSKIYITFSYDGLLISLYGDKELLTDDFLHGFGIGYADK